MQHEENFNARSGLERSDPITLEELETKMKEEDRLLLRQFSQGNSAAFWKLWERYQNYLQDLCLRWSRGNHVEAEEALSRAIIKLLHELPAYAEEITNLKAWLTRFIHNVCVDMYREYQRQAKGVENIEAIQAVNGEVVLHVSESPEEAFLRREMYEYVRHAIDGLPPRLREPLILRHFQEMPYADIAKQLTISNENVRKRIQQARVILKEKLHEYLLGLDGLAVDKPWFRETAIVNSEEPVANDYILNQEAEEIKFKVATISIVQITLPSGVELSVNLTLERKPTRPDHTLERLRMYVQRHPRGWKKRLDLAYLLYTLGDWQEAIHEYRRILERQPQLFDVWLQLGKILQQMERDGEAIVAYERALQLAHKSATQRHVHGIIELCGGRFAMAVEAFEEAVLLEPHNVAHWHILGLTYLRIDRPDAALQAFDKALKCDQGDIVALIHSHDALSMLDCLEEAQRRVTRALEFAPENVPALKRMADHRSRMGLVYGVEGEKTYQLIQEALRLAPGAVDVHESLALYYILRGEWENGRAVLRTFTEQHPYCPHGWRHYARSLFYTGDAQAAANAIMKAHVLYRKDVEIYRAACEILPYAGRLAELHPLVEEMLQRFSERWTVWITAGLVLGEWFKEATRARDTSIRGLQLHPHLANAWLGYGRVLSVAGRHQEAITALEHGWKCLASEECNDQLMPVAACLAESYLALDEEEKGLSWWEEVDRRARKFTALNPAVAYYWQGRALEALGDVPGMLQAYRATLKHNLLYPARMDVDKALKHLNTYPWSSSYSKLSCFLYTFLSRKSPGIKKFTKTSSESSYSWQNMPNALRIVSTEGGVMKLKTTSFVEHQSSGKQEVVFPAVTNALMLAPGGSTTCWGTSCTTTCI